MSSKTVADGLKQLDDSRYRFIESGSAVLQAHRATALASIFPGKVSFARLTDAFWLGIEMLERARGGRNEPPEQIGILQELETAAPGLKPVAQGLKSILETLEPGTDPYLLVRCVISGVVGELKRYLGSPEPQVADTAMARQ